MLINSMPARLAADASPKIPLFDPLLGHRAGDNLIQQFRRNVRQYRCGRRSCLYFHWHRCFLTCYASNTKFLTGSVLKQVLQTLALKALNVAAQAALALAQYEGGLILGHDPRSSHRKLLEISSSGSPARSGPGLWGRVASLLPKPDRLLAKNRTTHCKRMGNTC